MTEYVLRGHSMNRRRWATRCHAIGIMFLAAIAGHLPSVPCSFCSDGAGTLCRIGLSSSMFTEVNENDVRA